MFHFAKIRTPNFPHTQQAEKLQCKNIDILKKQRKIRKKNPVKEPQELSLFKCSYLTQSVVY